MAARKRPAALTRDELARGAAPSFQLDSLAQSGCGGLKMHIASRVALFVFMGGPIGGIVTIVVVTAWSVSHSSSDIDLSLISFLITYLFVGALVGLFLGLPASFLTGLSHALFPQVRSWAPIGLIGGVTGSAEGFFMPNLVYVSGRADLDASLSFAAVFALAGATAALACHAQAKRALD